MKRKLLKGHRTSGDPLRLIYWTCPAHTCDTPHYGSIDELQGKNMSCIACGNSYTILQIIEETLSSAKILIDLGE